MVVRFARTFVPRALRLMGVETVPARIAPDEFNEAARNSTSP